MSDRPTFFSCFYKTNSNTCSIEISLSFIHILLSHIVFLKTLSEHCSVRTCSSRRDPEPGHHPVFIVYVQQLKGVYLQSERTFFVALLCPYDELQWRGLASSIRPDLSREESSVKIEEWVLKIFTCQYLMLSHPICIAVFISLHWLYCFCLETPL